MVLKIITDEELKIIECISKDLFNKYAIREIANKMNKASYSWVFNAIKRLSSLGIINIEPRRGSNLCSLNLDNLLLLVYLALIEQKKINKNLPLENIKELMDSIELGFFTFIVTGSYSRGDYTKKSDIDIAVIVENKNDVKKTEVILKNKGELMVPKPHIFVFSKDEFLQMLLEKGENYGKELSRNKIILFGAENYYRILKGAVDYGFKG